MTFFIPRKRVTPKDNVKYVIPKDAIIHTQKVLEDYANLTPSNEGLVYWAGKKEADLVTVSLVIAPKTTSDWGYISTSNRANFDVVKTLAENYKIHIGQVHSHPGSFVDHSDGDDHDASFKIEGLVSIVVPNYCKDGMLPLTKCGIHRYDNRNFHRFSDKYVSEHFEIFENLSCDFVDLRK